MDTSHLLEKISDHLKEKGYSGNTIRAYLDTMSMFIHSGSPITADSAEAWIIEKYSGTSRANIRRHICSLNIMLSYLQKKRMHPLSRMNIIIGERKQKPALIPGRLPFKSSGDTSMDMRNRAILELLQSTGIWVDSVCGLTIPDVSPDYRTITVTSPAGVRTEFTVPGYSRTLLRQYITSVRPKLSGSALTEYVFISRKGGRLNRKSLWRICHKMDLPEPRSLRMISVQGKKNL